MPDDVAAAIGDWQGTSLGEGYEPANARQELSVEPPLRQGGSAEARFRGLIEAKASAERTDCGATHSVAERGVPRRGVQVAGAAAFDARSIAMPRKLKVFRTAIGFHDAYVAAPSQKAALEAWGAAANLFARGAAEQVSDAELSKEPLANPGKVIKRLRGSESEHFAALERASAADSRRKPRASAARKTKPRPRPDRKPLDDAEETLDGAQRAAEQLERDFRERERRLAHERQAAERAAGEVVRKARSARDAEKLRYEEMLARWRA